MPRRFQFSLRTLLAATAIACGLCAWFAYNANIVRQRRAFWPLFNGERSYCLREIGTPGYSTDATVPWLRHMLGDFPIHVIFYEVSADPDGTELVRVRKLFPEAEIWGWPGSKEKLPDGMKPWPENRFWMI
jgi:hypothetical protein